MAAPADKYYPLTESNLGHAHQERPGYLTSVELYGSIATQLINVQPLASFQHDALQDSRHCRIPFRDGSVLGGGMAIEPKSRLSRKSGGSKRGKANTHRILFILLCVSLSIPFIFICSFGSFGSKIVDSTGYKGEPKRFWKTAFSSSAQLSCRCTTQPAGRSGRSICCHTPCRGDAGAANRSVGNRVRNSITSSGVNGPSPITVSPFHSNW